MTLMIGQAHALRRQPTSQRSMNSAECRQLFLVSDLPQIEQLGWRRVLEKRINFPDLLQPELSKLQTGPVECLGFT